MRCGAERPEVYALGSCSPASVAVPVGPASGPSPGFFTRTLLEIAPSFELWCPITWLHGCPAGVYSGGLIASHMESGDIVTRRWAADNSFGLGALEVLECDLEGLCLRADHQAGSRVLYRQVLPNPSMFGSALSDLLTGSGNKRERPDFRQSFYLALPRCWAPRRGSTDRSTRPRSTSSRACSTSCRRGSPRASCSGSSATWPNRCRGNTGPSCWQQLSDFTRRRARLQFALERLQALLRRRRDTHPGGERPVSPGADPAGLARPGARCDGYGW